MLIGGGGVQIDPPQKKLPSKNPALLGLKWIISKTSTKKKNLKTQQFFPQTSDFYVAARRSIIQWYLVDLELSDALNIWRKSTFLGRKI